MAAFDVEMRHDNTYSDVVVHARDGWGAMEAAMRRYPSWHTTGTVTAHGGQWGLLRQAAAAGSARMRTPSLPRASGRHSAATRLAMARQARQGERTSVGKVYQSWWPRDGTGRFTERCTGPRSQCNLDVNDPKSYGLYRERDRARRRAGIR